MSSYDIEKLDEQIAECLSGNGDFDLLQRLKAEKAELQEKAYFDSIQSLKQQIQALEAQRITDYGELNELQSEFQSNSKILDERAAALLEVRQARAEIEAKIYFKQTAIDGNKSDVKEKKIELGNLIKSRMEQV